MYQALYLSKKINSLIFVRDCPCYELIYRIRQIIGDEKEGSSKDNTESSEPKTYLKLSNIAVFKDDKFVSWTTEEESYGISIINNKITEMYIKIKMDDGYVVVLTGDAPLITEETMRNAVEYHAQSQNSATVITAILDDATGYGRIVRDDDNNVLKIVEQKDATEAEKPILFFKDYLKN